MIEIRALTFSFESGGKKVLDRVAFDIEQRRFVAILGNNGAGKSTLLKCINRIHKINEGSVLIDGKSVLEMSRQDMAKTVAYVPQSEEASHTMVFDAVLLGRKPYIKWDVSLEDKQIVSNILKRLDLADYASRHINQLSGGELQKVALARAMAQQPRFLLLDEPTSSLDPRNQHEMLKLLRQIALEENMGAAIVIHDLNLAVRYCDRFLFLKDSAVYAYGGEETVTPETIRQVYGMTVEIIEHKGVKLIVPE